MRGSLIIFLSLLLMMLLISCSSDSQENEYASGEDEKRVSTRSSADGGLIAIQLTKIDLYALDVPVFAVTDSSQQVDVEDEIYYTGNFYYPVNHIYASPGETFLLLLTTVNESSDASVSHNWVLMDDQVSEDELGNHLHDAESVYGFFDNYVDNIIARTDRVPTGLTDEINFVAPEEKGEYLFFCTTPGHFAKGMKGYLVVE